MSTYLTSKAADIQSKASTLKDTAKTQSESELATTQETDLNTDGNAQTGLNAKATLLASKAEALHTAADAIVTEAANPSGSPLQPLNETAKKLKTAAKGGGSSDLHKAAKELANKAQQPGEPASGEADQVMEAFDKVDNQYIKLMAEYKKILDNAAQASKLTEGDKEKVTAVVKAFHGVKTTYYQMIIGYRIQQKANTFHTEAKALKTKAESAGEGTPLGKLQTAAKKEMAELVDRADQLKEINVGTETDAQIVEKYLKVAQKYNELEKIQQFTAALKAKESKELVERVKETFEALKKSIENVLKLRVQELAAKAQALSEAANTLSGVDVSDLNVPATALRDAASTGTEGLTQKALLLVQAINSPDGDPQGTKATEVITQFNTVQEKYKELITKATEINKQDDVKNVYDAYTNLKTLYDNILNFTKIKYYADQLDTKATSIATGSATPSEVKPLIDKLESVYSAIPDDQSDIKSIFQNDFESI